MMDRVTSQARWDEINASLGRIKRGLDRIDSYWSRELDADEPEADDLWDDAQDAERFARGLGFADYDEYYAASYEAFAAWVDGQHTYERAE